MIFTLPSLYWHVSSLKLPFLEFKTLFDFGFSFLCDCLFVFTFFITEHGQKFLHRKCLRSYVLETATQRTRKTWPGHTSLMTELLILLSVKEGSGSRFGEPASSQRRGMESSQNVDSRMIWGVLRDIFGLSSKPKILVKPQF